MAAKVIQISKEIGDRIKARRNELGLTIEDAADMADVGTKTWSRYEAGSSIRHDKYRGVCRVLGLATLDDSIEPDFSWEKVKSEYVWSDYLCETYGREAALSFAVGSGELLDYIDADMDELSQLSSGSHLGQAEMSYLDGMLPEQFLTRYDYEFLYRLRSSVKDLQARVRSEPMFRAHTVLEEIALYLCAESSICWMDNCAHGEFTQDELRDWVFDLFDDEDLLMFLYSGRYVNESCPYHFVHWDELQFYVPISSGRMAAEAMEEALAGCKGTDAE